MSEAPENKDKNTDPVGAPVVEVEAVLEPGQPKPKGLKRYIPVAVIFLAFTVFFVGGFQDLLSFDAVAANRAQFVAWAADNQILAVAAFMALYVVVVGLSLPGGTVLTLAGGFVFGGWMAGTYVVIAATLGSIVIFLGARYAFADLCHARAGSSLAKMEHGFRDNAFSYLLFLRLVPVFPFWLVNLVPALLDVRLATYAVATLLGIIPGTFVYAHVGAGMGSVLDAGGTPDLGVIFQPQVLAPVLALALLSLVPVAYKKLKGKG